MTPEANAREAMLAERERQASLHPEVSTAAELAPHMGVHEREYWNWQLERYFAAELGPEGSGDEKA